MIRSRSTEAQITDMLKEQEAGTSAAASCRNYGIRIASFYTCCEMVAEIETMW